MDDNKSTTKRVTRNDKNKAVPIYKKKKNGKKVLVSHSNTSSIINDSNSDNSINDSFINVVDTVVLWCGRTE